MPSTLRSSGQSATPRPIEPSGEYASTGAPSTVSEPAVGPVDAEQQGGDLRPARAEQPGEADDLAGAQLQVERLDRAVPAEARRATSVVAPAPCWLVSSLILVMSSSSVSSRPSIFAISSMRGSPAVA